MRQLQNKVIRNASWIIICKIVQSICAFIIGACTARFLGPSNYGLISYAASVVAFFVPIMQLGFNATLVQEFISQPEQEGEILGTAIVFSIISSITCIIGITIFSIIASPSNAETTIVCFLYSLTLIFQAGEMTQYWFQAKLASKYSSIIALISYLIVAAYKIYILIDAKSIYWFAITHTFETMIIAGLLLITYFKQSSQKLRVSWIKGKEMLFRSRPYIISGMMVMVFQQTDRIMLRWMVGEKETGYYSAALTCIGVTGFIFSAIIDSARPSILESKKKSKSLFEEKMILLYSVITIISILQSITMTSFSRLIVRIIYGVEFMPAATILQVAVWYITFGYYGTIRNIWILAEGKQKFLWRINLLGALTNVIINFMLIPVWGGCGAAIASLVTQVLVNVVLCFVIKPIRPCAYFIIEAFKLKTIKKL